MRTAADLIEECIGGNAEARSEFVSRFHRNIVAILVKVACRNQQGRAELIQDLAQDVYLRIFADDSKCLRSLRSRDEASVAGLVQAIAYSVACDHFREGRALKRGGGVRVVSLDDSQTPEVAREPDDILRSIVFSQIDKTLVGLVENSRRAEQRTVFWLYFRHGLSARDIAALPGCALSAKGVESLLLRLTRAVRERLAAPRCETSGEGKAAVFPSPSSGAR